MTTPPSRPLGASEDLALGRALLEQGRAADAVAPLFRAARAAEASCCSIIGIRTARIVGG